MYILQNAFWDILTIFVVSVVGYSIYGELPVGYFIGTLIGIIILNWFYKVWK